MDGEEGTPRREGKTKRDKSLEGVIREVVQMNNKRGERGNEGKDQRGRRLKRTRRYEIDERSVGGDAGRDNRRKEDEINRSADKGCEKETRVRQTLEEENIPPSS